MTELKKIRIGTDIIVEVRCSVSGKPVTWSETDIRHVFAFSDIQGQPVAEMAYRADGQALRCTYAAKDQNYTGAYRVIIEFSDGAALASSLDIPAFEIVRTTEEADADVGEVVLDIDGTMRFYSLSEAISKIEGATSDAESAAALATSAAGRADASAEKADSAAASASETDRAVQAAEELRRAAESSRVSAETSRVNAESSRVKSETGRASAEKAREDAEGKRASAETERADSETSRKDAEKIRENAELERKKAEMERGTAENVRKFAEMERNDAESERRTSENTRKEAETSRVNAEAARVAEFGRLKTESETATRNAQDAADIAAVNILALDISGDSGDVTVTTGGDSSAFSSGTVDTSTGDVSLTFDYD